MQKVENYNRSRTYKTGFATMHSKLTDNQPYRDALMDGSYDGKKRSAEQVDSYIWNKSRNYAINMVNMLHFDYGDVSKAMPFEYEPEISLGDYLRIASRGAEIVGAPSEGSGLGGVLATASKPLAKLGMELGTGIDKRQALAKKTYQDRVSAVAKLAGGLEEEKIKANRTFAKKQNLELFESKMNERIASLTEKRDSYDEGSEEYLKLDRVIRAEIQNRNDGMQAILTGSKTQQEQKREDRRDQRVNMQAAHQKEMISQRKEGESTKKFESSGNDILTGGAGMDKFSI